MHPILRTAIAVMLGMLIALMAMFLADRVNAYYFPSDQLNRTHEQIAKDIQSLPLNGFLLILAGFFFADFRGLYRSTVIPFNAQIVCSRKYRFFNPD
ncbi:MAG: hypothetical protein HWD58_05715 [Bacteroidota bacterium]|nr:MAG: hypothetical protein HWD58_05715 [Bacteroidota bacterium]